MTTHVKQDTKLMHVFGVSNPHAMPRITKVIVSIGVGKRREDKAFLEAVKKDISAITGQAPHERLARMSVSGFNVRQGNVVGFRVTLRGKRMRDFVERFIHITLPRVRDFRGVPISSFDGQGNLSVGLAEQLPFPEIQSDKTDHIFGLQITFATTAQDNEEGEKLFRALGFPLTEKAADSEESAMETRESRAAREREKAKSQRPAEAAEEAAS